MIVYELMMLYRALPKNEMKPILKRTAEAIYDKGGLIRKIENLGTLDTPYKISSHGGVHRKASYFLYECHIPLSIINPLMDEFQRDVDVIRRRLYKRNEPETFECTLDDELKPPPYRPDVQKLMVEANKSGKRKKQFNFGIGHYPFQR